MAHGVLFGLERVGCYEDFMLWRVDGMDLWQMRDGSEFTAQADIASSLLSISPAEKMDGVRLSTELSLTAL